MARVTIMVPGDEADIHAEVVGEVDGTGLSFAQGRGELPWGTGVGVLRLLGRNRVFHMVVDGTVLAGCRIYGHSSRIRFRYRT